MANTSTFTEDDDLEEEAGGAVASVSAMPDQAIERAFEGGRLRVVQDKNDFFLIHVNDFIKGRKWGNLRPEYQRRLRWDNKKKSKLIESFIMNVPVPPVFLYETAVGEFEVMDGQQRLNAVVEYFSNEFDLEGLTIWPDLNGRNFSKLPPLLRRGLERAKISAITLMADVTSEQQNTVDLRAQVFERLNTGGEKLNHQELRNCLYSGAFNQLVVDLAGWAEFTAIWGIPNHAENILSDGSITEKLTQNRLYSTMSDCQIVLRFFAFRDADKIVGSTKSILDSCMKENRNLPQKQVDGLRQRFMDVFGFCKQVFGDKAFRLPASKVRGIGSLSRPLYDAQIVALDHLYDFAQQIKDAKGDIRRRIAEACDRASPSYELIVGRPNTARAIKQRIEVVEQIIKEAIGA